MTESSRAQLKKAVQRLQRGEREAMAEVYRLTSEPLYVFALYLTGEEESARELLQATYLKILEGIDSLRDPASFLYWGKRIMVNHLRDQERHATHEILPSEADAARLGAELGDEDPDFIPDTYTLTEELRETVRQEIAKLPVEQRIAVVLFHFEGRSLREIAEMTGVPVNTVKSRLTYARQSIRTGLQKYEKKSGTKLPALGTLLPLSLAAGAGASGTVFLAGGADEAVLQEILATEKFRSFGAGRASATGSAIKAGSGIYFLASHAAAIVPAALITAGLISVGIYAHGTLGLADLGEDPFAVSGGATVSAQSLETASESVSDKRPDERKANPQEAVKTPEEKKPEVPPASDAQPAAEPEEQTAAEPEQREDAADAPETEAETAAGEGAEQAEDTTAPATREEAEGQTSSEEEETPADTAETAEAAQPEEENATEPERQPEPAAPDPAVQPAPETEADEPAAPDEETDESEATTEEKSESDGEADANADSEVDSESADTDSEEESTEEETSAETEADEAANYPYQDHAYPSIWQEQSERIWSGESVYTRYLPLAGGEILLVDLDDGAGLRLRSSGGAEAPLSGSTEPVTHAFYYAPDYSRLTHVYESSGLLFGEAFYYDGSWGLEESDILAEDEGESAFDATYRPEGYGLVTSDGMYGSYDPTEIAEALKADGYYVRSPWE